MPARSSGCFQCRKRKIRCDEGRPGCEKCFKHGVPCPGYRREKGGLEFEDQTVLTVRKAKESYGEKGALVSRKSSNSGSARSTPDVQSLDLNRNAFQAWPFFLPPTMLNSPAANQMQLYDKWLNIYTPQTCGRQGLHFDYLRVAINLAESEPALRDGINTLALVQVGHANNDEHLLAASVPSYGKALASLAFAVSRATSVRDNTVLAAASLLVVCEFYDKIKTQGISWFRHVDGVQQLLLARGPDSLDTDLSLMLYCNARHASLARSFLIRKADSYDTPAWRAAAFRAPMQDWSAKLFDAAIRVPRLLQRSDELDVDSLQALSRIQDLLHDCETLEADFRRWHTGFHSSVAGYEVVPVESFKTFCTLVADRTMPKAYRFSNFMIGYVYSQFWIAMHYLRSTIKTLREQRQNLDPFHVTDFSQAVTDEELNSYTFDLCRTIPQFVEPTSGTQGHIAIFLPLAVITMHFGSRQNLKWCMWAANVKETVFNMGLRQPHVKERDLNMRLAKPKGGLSPFPNDAEMEPFQTSASQALEVKAESLPSTIESEEVTFTADDFADVDLSTDWSEQLPGFAAAVQGVPEAIVGCHY